MLSSDDDGHCSVTAMEKALLLALVLKWHKDSDTLKSDQIREFERKIWLSHIHSAIEQEEQDKQPVGDDMNIF